MPRSRRLKKLRHLFFPSRASTQTWMFLTFVVFVGSAVVAVAIYVTFLVRVQMHEALEQALVDQAQRIMGIVHDSNDPKTRESLREMSLVTGVDISVVHPDGVAWHVVEGKLQDVEGHTLRAGLPGVRPGETVYQRLRKADDENRYAVVLAHPETGLLLRVEQAEPELFTLSKTMILTLILGMVMALVMALIGSWTASQKITQPLQAIRNSALNISEGKLNEKIWVTTRSAEIQDLARNINRMSGSYREKIEELERLTRLQNEFIGNVSHEVRNPIFAVSGYLEALGSPKLSDEMRQRYAEKGLTNLQRLNTLFNDLIEIARLEYREDLIKTSIFDLEELAEEVAEMLRPKAREKGITLIVENPHSLVLADRNRIRQVFVNLIDNAIAYSDEGTVRCRFSRRLDKVRVEIVDNGRGIPEEHLDRIFERFYRVDPDRSRKSGGTGLGLSIVKQILQAHGEQIHVESTVGRGTRFWFELSYAGQPEEVVEA